MSNRIMKKSIVSAIVTSSMLLLSNWALADSAVTLTASPTSTTLPDGQTIPMWGYTCGDSLATPVASVNATCSSMKGVAQSGATWQPPLITVPSGQTLTITLINKLYETVPTSLVIVGQIGGGLGDVAERTTMPSPAHNPQGTTWPGTLGTTTGPDDAVFTPPKQADRVRSFATEVKVSDVGGKALVWKNLRPGTYLIESGTEPSIQGPMGLYGVLVVTDSVAPGTAYGQAFDKDVPLLLSEIDPNQNIEVAQVVKNVGFADTTVWSGKAGDCGDVTKPASMHTCYPPVVNYSPLYYLINGVSFDRGNSTASSMTVPSAGASKNVLLRLVNAGLRMHVPSVVGARMTLLAEDSNKLPGAPRKQSEVLLTAGKTYDVTISPAQTVSGTYDAATYAVFDRALGLSTNNQHDGGMQAFINVAGGAAPANQVVVARADTYSLVAGSVLAVAEAAKGVTANDTGVYGVSVLTPPTGVGSTLVLNPDGTFTYSPGSGVTSDSFTYCANGSVTGSTCSSGVSASVTLSACTGTCLGAAPVAGNGTFVSNIASRLQAASPGVLSYVTNPSGLPLTVTPATNSTCGSVTLNPDGSFIATPVSVPGSGASATCTFNYNVSTSTKQSSAADGTITVNFNGGSGIAFNVQDAKNGVAIADYRWIIEEDQTFWIDPKCQINSKDTNVRPASCPPLPVESLGYNFHTAHMPVVAQGCVGDVSCEAGQTQNGTPVVCDVGNGVCRQDADKLTSVLPSDVYLDPSKRYFISILPGDGVNATIGGAGGADENGKPFNIIAACGEYTGPTGAWEPAGTAALCGHAMGGGQIAPGQTAMNIKLQRTPLPTAKLSVFVFQDDNPLNGENDAGGGVDVIAPNEPGLGGFEIKLFDQAGGLGDNTGQITYDEFNQPVSNALANKKDPITGLDACPINSRGDGLVGMVPTCPKYESDGKTLSPLAGQVVIANLYPGLYEVQAYPAADRIAAGEEWLQTNTLDGGKPHEAFLKPEEPGYFQEFGPGGFHVSIGYANPAIINARKADYCKSPANAGGKCNAVLNVQVTNNHMSRTPDQRTFSSETYDQYSFTQCYVSVGPADAEDFAIQKCNADGTVSFTDMPNGVFKISVFDQWNDIMLDGLVSTVSIDGDTATKVFPVTQWRTNLFTRTFIDQNGDGVSQDSEAGLALVNTNIHYRDGSIGFFNNTDLNGYAGFNEVFPFMNWLVVETTSTRFKPTGVHTVYDAGGAVDCSSQAGGVCSSIAANIASTKERVSLPQDLRAPGARYCADADCSGIGSFDPSINGSSATVFPAQPWGTTMGWQGLLGQNTFIEFGVKPFKSATSTTPAENGGISGMVIYASTRPFDDPSLSLQLSWEPGVPRAKVNLYQKTIDANGLEHLKLVDTTETASWDDWAQGFRRDANGNLMQAADGGYIPNMNCPGQDATSPFFATLKDSKQWLDPADSSGNKKPLAYKSQFKCYDGWSQLNQVQPAPYDGLYKFPSVVTVDPATGKPAHTNCNICIANPDDGNPMLPAGKYVVEVVVPPGYELVKEEDKNILLGDVYIAPVTQQFAGFGNIFIMPDQAAVASHYNPDSPGSLNLTDNLGATPRHEGDTGSVESFWPCVGAERIVPDLNSLYPDAGQAAPFAGAKRHLCDRKEVTLTGESSVLAKFFVFSSTHIAGHFTGTITNDFASEFDPFSPQFGEKFGPPNLPVGLRDFTGNEVARVYSDQWGIYNGLYFSSYSVNPPNPTGYVPQMSIACMNDPGPILGPNGTMITDPSYNPAYSNFCYEQPFMPGFTTYMDTPVIPTQAFADGYNLPDTEYPDGTPAIKSVTSGVAPGPWVKPATTAAPASVSFTVSGVNRCRTPQGGQNRCVDPSSISSVQINGVTVSGASAISCVPGGNNPDCSSNNNNIRNRNMAQAVAASIKAVSGFTATSNGATVTVTATSTGAALNGQSVVVNTTNLTDPGALALAGGIDASNAGMNLVITALGDKVVQNPNFSGPNSTAAPYNQKTITRHYGFGSSGTVALVGADGQAHPLINVNWSDGTITGTVNPNDLPPNCTVRQRGQAQAQCGELVITRADNGKQSIDSITVTVGGSAPWLVTETGVTAPAGKSVKDYGPNFGRIGSSPIQTAIDSASPGDLIIVAPGTYRENIIMWKPVRLQGVGAGSVTINADAHPAGKMDQWRRQMNCVFGLDLEGVPNLNDAAFDKDGVYKCPAEMHQRVDRIPFEAIVGWDASGNGNLAQVLQEPTLMGAYEGAGITVLGRGVRIPANSTDFWGVNATGGAGAFTDGSVYIGANDCTTSNSPNGRDYGTSNFYCNPSRIDGVSIINSSQGGGGLFIHGWGHNLEVSNTRISGNHGTLAGAINLGNGETPDAFINDGVECGVTPVVTPCPPIPNGTAQNAAIPFQFNTKVRIHNNMLYNNASIGDALFSGTPAGAGGITISAGADDYQIDHNWIAGNLSTGDGGGLQHLGLSFRGKMNNNYVLFNQSTNPTLPTNGGGIVIEGANLDRQLNGNECGSTNDQDCPPGLGEGTGPGIVIDSNLILGNSAESGSGGGLRIQQINGSEFVAFPHTPNEWYDVTATNNIIVNNVAGWDGGGVSMQDALKVSFVNNTVVSNDTTASAGVLFKTLGAIYSASPPPGCTPTTDPSLPQNPNCTGDNAQHGPQPAGLVAMAHTPNLVDAINTLGTYVTCPSGYGYTGGTSFGNLRNADCIKLSKPALTNDLFWQNRSFSVDIVGMGTGNLSQQNLVALHPLLNQTGTGQCAAGADYWDIGLRTDDITAGLISKTANKLGVSYSIISGDPQGVLTQSNPVGSPASPVIAQYCNGARMPPEHCKDEGIDNGSPACQGYNAPPGASETTGLTQVFVFNGIKPTATVDEGHNWLNLTYGPLTLSRPDVTTPTAGEIMLASASTGTSGGAYSIPGTSAAVNNGTNSGAPTTDFFGNARARTSANKVDVGAVECQGTSCVGVSGPLGYVTGGPLSFGDVIVGRTSSSMQLVLNNTGNATLTGIALSFSSPRYSRPAGSAGGTCGTSLTASNSCTINVVFTPTATGSVDATLSITGNATVIGSPVSLSGNGITPVVSASLAPATWSATQTRNCPGSGFGGRLACAADPNQVFTLTNTGNATLTGIGTASLSGPNTADFTVVTFASTCGTNSFFGDFRSLAPGATCTVTVGFRPLTSEATGTKNATVNVATAAGTKSATLVGTAN
jgi:hypothetical protein